MAIGSLYDLSLGKVPNASWPWAYFVGPFKGGVWNLAHLHRHLAVWCVKNGCFVHFSSLCIHELVRTLSLWIIILADFCAAEVKKEDRSHIKNATFSSRARKERSGDKTSLGETGGAMHHDCQEDLWNTLKCMKQRYAKWWCDRVRCMMPERCERLGNINPDFM